MPPKDKTEKAKQSASEKPNHLQITITEDGKQYRLRSDELGPADDLACRQATGYPVGHFLDNFSSDSYVVVIWVARRKHGEPNLPFGKVLDAYPTYAAFSDLDVDVKYDNEEPDPLADED